MATIKPVLFKRLPEIDENDGKVILYDGSQLGRSTKEFGEIIDDRLRTGLEDGKQYAMTTSGWKDVVIPEVDLTPYAYSAGLEADKQFVMTDNGWVEVDLSQYALSVDVDSKAEEISAWANETFLTGINLSDYALSADVDTKADEITSWVNDTLNDYALSADIDTKADEITAWVDEKLFDYALSADVNTKAEEIATWVNDTLNDYALSADVDIRISEVTDRVEETLNNYALSADVDTKADEITSWANDIFVTSANLEAEKQYSLTTDGWHEIEESETVNLVPGTGIVFRDGTGADEGKTFVEVDNTNYKLLTTAEYNSLTAVIDTISSYSARWVLTNN